jgi:LPXTG-site transpeptidase (sortase) family protein
MQLKLQKNAKITLSILFIFIGIGLLTFNYFGSIKSNVFNEKNIQLLEQQIVVPQELIDVETGDDVGEEPTITTPTTDGDGYIGYLTVPDVNVKRGFTNFDSPYNQLKYNIMLIEGSTMPDVKNGNLILAGHNGHSSYSFFKDLYKLDMGAYAYINYNGKIYSYKLKNRYDVPKVGTISITRNPDVSTLTLITCHHTDNDKQVVFIFELEDVNIAQ